MVLKVWAWALWEEPGGLRADDWRKEVVDSVSETSSSILSA